MLSLLQFINGRSRRPVDPKYIVKRLVLAVASFFIIMSMLFVLIRLLPNPVVQVSGGYAKALEDMRTAWGYYDPIIVQYGIFLKKVFLEFDWGFCTTVGTFLQPVGEYLMSKLPATLYINGLALIIALPLGVIFGIIAAVFKNKWQDQVINVFIMFFISIPSFVYAVMFQYFIGFKLGWCPLILDSVFLVVSMFYVAVGLLSGILFDLSYGIIDPRIRMGGGKTNEL